MKNHPLFPPKDEGGESPDIAKILVCRWEGGTMVTAPRSFLASELTSEEQLFELFGGGKYELVGRDEKAIKRKVPIVLPGRPKPLDGTPMQPEAERAPPPMAAPPAGVDVGLLQVVMQMGTQQMNFMQAMMKDSEARSREFLALMAGQQAQSSQASQQSSQQMMALMGALIESRPTSPAPAAGGGFQDAAAAVFDIMRRGAEFAQGANQATEGASGGGAGLADLLNPENLKEWLSTLERAKALADKDGPIKPGDIPGRPRLPTEADL